MTRAAVLLATLVLAAAPAGATRTNLAPSYHAIRAQLHMSAVPVLLPVTLPRAFGTVRSVAVMSAGPDGYEVGFSPVANCAGALSCAFFHVAGYRPSAHFDRSYRRDDVVRLPDGARGFFRRTDCSGAGCTEAQLVFERGRAVYELDAKVGRENLPALERAYAELRVVR